MPANLGSLALNASLHMRAGRPHEAEILYKQILEQDTEHHEALFNLAQLLIQQKRNGEGDVYYRQFLALGPGATDLHNSMGRFCHMQGKYLDAISCFRQARALGDNSLEVHRNMGDALLDQGCAAESLASYEKALELAPDNAIILALLAEAHRALNHFDDALSYARRAIEIEPGLTYSQRTLAWTLLLLGDYASGLPLHEKRLNLERTDQFAELGIPQRVAQFSGKPRWQGEDLQGKTLLVWTEQGMGDNIMMMRYLPLLNQKNAGSVLVYCHPPLVKTMLTISGLVVSTEFELSNDTFDLHCSMLCLPHLFGTRLESIPADVPYLRIPPTMNGKWEKQLKKFEGYKVGIAWAGSKNNSKDSRRSIALECFAPLMAIPGIQFVSLQKEEAAQQLAATHWRVLDWMSASEDFLDTGALIGNLDLVISVDTAIVHLAGALGKPVWLLNRFESEWRWMMDRNDSPWYPSMRIFRQPAMHDWDSVLKAVAVDLSRIAGAPGTQAMSDEQWETAARASQSALGIKKNPAPNRGIFSATIDRLHRLLPGRWRR